MTDITPHHRRPLHPSAHNPARGTLPCQQNISMPLQHEFNSENDDRLSALASQGDRRAADALCSRYLEPLQRYFRCRLDGAISGVDADDLASETILGAIESLRQKKYKHGGTFRGWVFGIAHNKLALLFRRHKPMDSLTESSDVATDDIDPLASLDAQEQYAALRDCLSRLDEKLRNLFKLRILDNHTFAELAVELTMADTTVFNRFGQAKAKLAKCMEGK